MKAVPAAISSAVFFTSCPSCSLTSQQYLSAVAPHYREGCYERVVAARPAVAVSVRPEVLAVAEPAEDLAVRGVGAGDRVQRPAALQAAAPHCSQ